MGGTLGWYGVMRKDAPGSLLAALGVGLLARSISNMGVNRIVNTVSQPQQQQKQQKQQKYQK